MQFEGCVALVTGATALRWFIYLAPKPHWLPATSENTRRQTCG